MRWDNKGGSDIILHCNFKALCFDLFGPFHFAGWKVSIPLLPSQQDPPPPVLCFHIRNICFPNSYTNRCAKSYIPRPPVLPCFTPCCHCCPKVGVSFFIFLFWTINCYRKRRAWPLRWQKKKIVMSKWIVNDYSWNDRSVVQTSITLSIYLVNHLKA